MEFEIGDMVDVGDLFGEVTGVIHDDERLFIIPVYGQEEREVPFKDVRNTWRLIKEKTPCNHYGEAIATDVEMVCQCENCNELYIP